MLLVREVGMPFGILHDAAGGVVWTMVHIANGMEEFVGGHFPSVSLLVLQSEVGGHAVLVFRSER